MSLSRIYQALPLHVGHSLSLDMQISHRLSHVLRAKVDDHLTLFNGEGGEYEAVITRIDKKKMDVKVLNFVNRECESPLSIHLAQGVARGEKMDFIVQKATELGVTKITPLLTERSNVRLSREREDKRILHWQSVAVSACEQSGRNRIPEISAFVPFKEWLLTAKADHLFVLSPHVQAALPKGELAQHATVIILIGPEGGLSDDEMDEAMKKEFLPLNLGPRILRTETASLAAIVTLQSHYGDFI